MKNNYLKFNFIFIVAIIALFIVVPISNAATINAGNYEYFDDGGYVYEYNAKTKEKKQLLSGAYIHLSNKKDQFTYVFRKSASSSQAEGFYVYNLVTSENKLLFESEYGDPIGITGWSPDDKYIIVYAATYVIGQTTILDSNTGMTMASFETHENVFIWINSDEVILTDLQDINRPNGPANGIAIINIVTGKKKILKQATPTDDYWLIKYEPNKILFSSRSIAPGGIWGEAKERKTYWLMDNNGNVLEEVKDYKTQ